MDYKNARVINPEGGLMVQRDDATYFYCAPGTAQYQNVVDTLGADVEPYVDQGPPPEEVAAHAARMQRDTLLAQLDAIVANPLRWAGFSAEQQAAFAAYRQALLDVPQQAGFPADIVWPVFPGSQPA